MEGIDKREEAKLIGQIMAKSLIAALISLKVEETSKKVKEMGWT